MHQNSRIEQVEEIIRRNSDMVYRLAFSMVKMQQDAEDVCQEVWMTYIRKMPTFESSEHEKAWFIRVTVNLCKNMWKSAWRQKMVSTDMSVAEEIMPGDGTFDKKKEYSKAESKNLWEESLLTDKEEGVVEAVKRLPVKYRAVIHLFYYEEMSIEEIARSLKLRPSNVRTRLTRARNMLKEWLREDV